MKFMKTKITLAALSASALAAAAILTFAEPAGTPLAITNIAVNGGVAHLAWEEDVTRQLSDLKLYESTSLTGGWTEVTNYVSAKTGGGASVAEDAEPVKFFRLFAEDTALDDPEVTWTNRVSHTIVINLEDGDDKYTVTRLPADFCVANDPAAKTNHLYLRYITKTPDGTNDWMGSLAPGEASPVGVTNLNLSGYYIGVYQVTEAQYRLVKGGNPIGLTTPTGDDRPVAMISYDDIRGTSNPGNAPAVNSFLWTLSNEVYQANNGIALSFDLPTEAQWEVACRAGTVGTFNFTNAAGNPLTDTMWYPAINEVAWWGGNLTEGDAAYGSDVGRPVGTRRANHAGLYDMHGNVWEWCRDSWVSGTYPAVGGGDQPVLGGSLRPLRGGNWATAPAYVRSAGRFSYTSPTRYANVGFRICARGAEVEP